MKRKMIFNGINLDDTVPGFRTLSVEGRAFNDIEIELSDNPGDGATFLSERIPERELSVTFMLKPSGSSVRAAQIKLLGLLNSSEPKQLIFTDEPDIYFNAIYSGYKISEEHDKVRSGTISFTCADPFKHAVTPKTFTAESVDGILTANIVNEGTVPVPITYNVTMNSDNGYIGIVGDGGIMQYGYIDEADGETHTESERLANLSDLIAAADDHGTEAMHPYAREGTAGSLGTNTSWVSGKTFLALSDTGGNDKAWNGGMKTFTLPADSQGVTGAKNFYSYFHAFVYAGMMGQTGVMTLSFLTADDTPICGVNWYKTDASGNTGHYEVWAYDSTKEATTSRNAHINVLKDWTYQCNHLSSQNPWYWDWGHCDVRKSGSKVTFFYNARYYTFDIPEIADMECAKIQFSIKSAKDRTGSKALSRLGIDVLRFDKTNVEKWNDLPNRYASGDEVEINGDEGKIYVNGMARMGDEITGTTYFKAEPGTNKVEIYNSSWAESVTVKATIREAWL